MTTDREAFEKWVAAQQQHIKNEESVWAMWFGWQAASELKDKEIEQLKAKLAMCVEAISNMKAYELSGAPEFTAWEFYYTEIYKALSATEQDVQKWRREVEAKAIEECASKFRYGVGYEYELLEIAQKKRSE